MLQAVPVHEIEEFKTRTARKLLHVLCPDHHQPPRLRFAGSSLRDVSIQLSGCCDKLIGLANRAIAEKPASSPHL